MAYHLFVNDATFFLGHATLSKMVALSMAALELMVLACCSWLLFLAAVLGWLFLCISGPFSLPWTFGFLQLKPNSVSQDNFRFLDVSFSYVPFSCVLRFLTLHVFLRYTFSYVTRFLTLCRLGVHHAFPWAQHVCCPSCLLHSATHSRRNHHC